jgi:hypothetical protein
MTHETNNAKARLLASKGKRTMEIWREHFPTSNYFELFAIVHNIAEPSAVGIREYILNTIPHLKSVIAANMMPGNKIAEATTDLFLLCSLYEMHLAK